MTEHDQPMSRPGQDTRLEADASVTRSEEELRITTHRRATHRARLRKRVVTEMVTKTVPVRREEVSLEYEPITADDDDRPTPGVDAASAQWMVLYEEEVVLTTQRVATERVRLVTHKITENREISEILRKEQIEIDRGARSA
jgi:uncharacterized protein (TIGR02271 family)